MESIAITGGKGTIGSVLQTGLSDYEIIILDKPEYDVTNVNNLVTPLKNKMAVIHLAWDMGETAHNSGKIPANIEMARNVLEAALESGVKRVILASSVHADRYTKNWDGEMLLSPYRENPTPEPGVPYGYSKLEIEKLAKEYIQKGLEVVNIRFGGVYKPDEIPPEEYKHVWLSHRDAVNLVRSILKAEFIPNNYAIVYGISNNQGRRIHDLSNPFNWQPIDNID